MVVVPRGFFSMPPTDDVNGPDGQMLPLDRNRRNSSGASGALRVSIASGNIVMILRRRDNDRRYFGGIENKFRGVGQPFFGK